MSLVIPISAKSFPKLFETVPKVLIITKIIVPLTFHILCTSTLGSWYLSTFSCSLWKIFWAPGITVSIFKHFFFPFLYESCLSALLQSFCLYWYWSPIEVYIHLFSLQFLVYRLPRNFFPVFEALVLHE